MSILRGYIGKYILALVFAFSFNTYSQNDIKNFPTPIYQNRFKEFEEVFDKYSENKPIGLSELEFKSLLVAIAERESSLGYPNGRKKDPNMIMGFGNPNKDKYKGLENQLDLSSECLKDAFDERNMNYKAAFDECGKDKLKAILSIYNQGKINSKGMKYAEEVYFSYKKWFNYFKAQS
ncbi:MAG: hypothetical protein QXI33_02455 [Candidatus Pacearchaeota archaeon]